jgi:hypothetical protein
LLDVVAMIISALVVTLSPQPSERAAAMAAITRDPRLTTGDAVGDRLPVVAEAESAAHGAELCDALGGQPGVLRVDVVAIDFSLEYA